MSSIGIIPADALAFLRGKLAQNAVLVHQIHSVGSSEKHGGFTQAIKNDPEWGAFADPYQKRRPSKEDAGVAMNEDQQTPGDIVTFSPPDDSFPVVIGICGQKLWHIPNPKRVGQYPDELWMRPGWFQLGLDKLKQKLLTEGFSGTVYFPYKVACNLGGGDWENHYLPMIENFAQGVPFTVKFIKKE